MRRVLGLLAAAIVIAGCGAATPSKAPATTAASATTVATGTAAPASGGSVRSIYDGALPAGTYTVLNGAATIDVPAGWQGCCGAFGVLKSDVVALLFEDVTNVIVYADSCKWKAGPNPEPKGAQAVAAAFSAQRGHQGTAPEAATVAGLPGWKVRLTVPADQPVTMVGDNNAFTGCDNAQFATWGLKNGGGEPSRYQQGPSQIDTLFLVDVGDRTYVIDMVTDAGISASDQAQIDAMLASLKFQ